MCILANVNICIHSVIWIFVSILFVIWIWIMLSYPTFFRLLCNWSSIWTMKFISTPRKMQKVFFAYMKICKTDESYHVLTLRIGTTFDLLIGCRLLYSWIVNVNCWSSNFKWLAHGLQAASICGGWHWDIFCPWQIAGNTGSIARTCAASAVALHLVEVNSISVPLIITSIWYLQYSS